jgi:LmbE family N-acetylglucosaminyl deacetylase
LESDLIPYSASQGLPARAVLVLAPHPDDEVFGCGGAISRHVDAGHPVHVVVLTDGALYGDAIARQHESTAAAKVLGYGTPEFWNYPDRGLPCDDALVQRTVEKIAQTGADLVYAPSPWEIHPDHQQAHRLAVEAVRCSAPNVRLAFYEIGAPLRPNLLLDLTALLSIKEAAMRCFGSQLLQQDYVAHIQALNRYRSYTLGPEVLAAEAFWLVSPQELDRTLRESLFSLLSHGNLPQTASAAAIAAPAASAPSLYQRFRNWRAKVLS